jgi:hypothetical protein
LTTLDERMAENPHLASMVLDASTSNREVARTYDIDESIVRRWRHRNIVCAGPMAHKAIPQNGQTVEWSPGLDLSVPRAETKTLPAPVVAGVSPSDVELLEDVGADPEQWQIASRNESRWQGSSGEWLSSHKLTLERRRVSGELTVEQLSEILGEYSGYSGFKAWYGDGVFVVPISDLQAGKQDGGGTAALVDRFGSIVQRVRERLEDEDGCDLLVIPVLGDCIEGIVAMGGKLAMQLDISVTEQVRVYRRLLMHIVAELAPFASRVIVPVLPGNHDETYRQLTMPTHDSWAIEGASAVADAMADNPKYSHVSFVFPESEELVITLNVGTKDKPFVLAFTHGHLVKAPNNMDAWWSKQAFGKQQAGDADLLFTGHFHHLRVEQMGTGRTWIQVPALDGGSDWYRRQSGVDTPAGIISMRVTPGRGLGWEGMTVHTG